VSEVFPVGEGFLLVQKVIQQKASLSQYGVATPSVIAKLCVCGGNDVAADYVRKGRAP